MIAYKFLRSGRTGPFSSFQWPEPGGRVHVALLAACRSGIHACRASDLPWWLADELWEIELDGRVQVDQHKIIAPAGRLRSQIEAWTPACAQEYAEACAWRAHERAVQALTRAGHPHEARELASCATLDDVLVAARQVAEDIPKTRISLTIAGDGAARANGRACDERVHRGARGDATRRTGRLCGRTSLAIALARRAARPERCRLTRAMCNALATSRTNINRVNDPERTTA